MNQVLTYTIINISDIEKITISEIIETNLETIRHSIDELLFGIKFQNEPDFITNGDVVPVQTLTHLEALELMQTQNWSGEIS